MFSSSSTLCPFFKFAITCQNPKKFGLKKYQEISHKIPLLKIRMLAKFVGRTQSFS